MATTAAFTTASGLVGPSAQPTTALAVRTVPSIVLRAAPLAAPAAGVMAPVAVASGLVVAGGVVVVGGTIAAQRALETHGIHQNIDRMTSELTAPQMHIDDGVPRLSNYTQSLMVNAQFSQNLAAYNIEGAEWNDSGKLTNFDEIDWSDPQNLAAFEQMIDHELKVQEDIRYENSSAIVPDILRSGEGIVKEQEAEANIQRLTSAQQEIAMFRAEVEAYQPIAAQVVDINNAHRAAVHAMAEGFENAELPSEQRQVINDFLAAERDVLIRAEALPEGAERSRIVGETYFNAAGAQITLAGLATTPEQAAEHLNTSKEFMTQAGFDTSNPQTYERFGLTQEEFEAKGTPRFNEEEPPAIPVVLPAGLQQEIAAAAAERAAAAAQDAPALDQEVAPDAAVPAADAEEPQAEDPQAPEAAPSEIEEATMPIATVGETPPTAPAQDVEPDQEARVPGIAERGGAAVGRGVDAAGRAVGKAAAGTARVVGDVAEGAAKAVATTATVVGGAVVTAGGTVIDVAATGASATHTGLRESFTHITGQNSETIDIVENDIRAIKGGMNRDDFVEYLREKQGAFQDAEIRSGAPGVGDDIYGTVIDTIEARGLENGDTNGLIAAYIDGLAHAGENNVPAGSRVDVDGVFRNDIAGQASRIGNWTGIELSDEDAKPIAQVAHTVDSEVDYFAGQDAIDAREATSSARSYVSMDQRSALAEAGSRLDNLYNNAEFQNGIAIDLTGGLGANDADKARMGELTQSYAQGITEQLGVPEGQQEAFSQSLAARLYSHRDGAAFSGTNVVDAGEMKRALNDTAKAFGHTDIQEALAAGIRETGSQQPDATQEATAENRADGDLNHHNSQKRIDERVMTLPSTPAPGG